MKQLLHQLQLNASEGRHIFEYASLAINWWDDEHPTNYEIELIFGDELHIFLFYFVPDIDDIVERSMVLVAEYEANSGELMHALIASELKDQLYPKSTFPFEAEQGGYHLNTAKQVEETVQQLMALLPPSTPPVHSVLPEASHEGGHTIVEYTPGAFLPHFISMYFMNNDRLDEESLHVFIQLAINMEGVAYLEGIQQDAIFIYTQEAKTLKQKVLDEHQQNAFNEAALKLCTEAIQAYQLPNEE